MHHESRIGHLGGCLSCLDALLFLFNDWMDRRNDVFLLSKGHAAGALYIALWSVNELGEEDLAGFCRDCTRLAGHPIGRAMPAIEFSTGSLGHGLSLAAGMALGKRLAGEPGRVFCLTSDGEWQEGSTWEGLIFLMHHRLTNLTVLIDSNKLQAFGTTEAVASMEPLRQRIEAFGATTIECDGHDFTAIRSALEAPAPTPKVVILHTVKGKGVSFMENRIEWHYNTLTDEHLACALKDVDAL